MTSRDKIKNEKLYPLVSIIMCVYNGEEFLLEAMQSILMQSYKDIEFIIIDDGSTDRTKEIIMSARDERIIYIKNENNIGLPASLNKGLLHCSGKYIARMDCDDISFLDRIFHQVNFLEKNEEYSIVGTNTASFYNHHPQTLKINIFPKRNSDINVTSLFRTSFSHPTIMFRSNIIKKEKLWYDEKYKSTQDYDFVNRVLKYGKGYNIQKPLLLYREHKNSISKKNKPEQDSNRKKISIYKISNLTLNKYDESFLDILYESYHKNFVITDERFFHLICEIAEYLKEHEDFRGRYLRLLPMKFISKKLISKKKIYTLKLLLMSIPDALFFSIEKLKTNFANLISARHAREGQKFTIFCKKIKPDFHEVSGINFFVNPKSYLDLSRDNGNKISYADNIYIDGISLCVILKPILGYIKRISFDFSSIADNVFTFCEKSKKNIWICGGSKENINRFIEIIEKRYPDISISGYRNGYFNNENEKKAQIDKIIQKKPDILLVGMGSSLQEDFIKQVNPKSWNGVAFTCGAFIQQTAESRNQNYYPEFINELNIRFLYRLIKNPKLFKRYFVTYPFSIMNIILNLFYIKASRSRSR